MGRSATARVGAGNLLLQTEGDPAQFTLQKGGEKFPFITADQVRKRKRKMRQSSTSLLPRRRD